MKTTIELSDVLLGEVREVAAREETTLRALVEEGLRIVLAQRRGRTRPFKLPDASYKGRGLHPDVTEGSWEQLRDLVYQGRGA